MMSDERDDLYSTIDVLTRDVGNLEDQLECANSEIEELKEKVELLETDNAKMLPLARIGEWWEQVFLLKFAHECPTPRDALLGCRLRIQISLPHGDWVSWRRDGKY